MWFLFMAADGWAAINTLLNPSGVIDFRYEPIPYRAGVKDVNLGFAGSCRA